MNSDGDWRKIATPTTNIKDFGDLFDINQGYAVGSHPGFTNEIKRNRHIAKGRDYDFFHCQGNSTVGDQLGYADLH